MKQVAGGRDTSKKEELEGGEVRSLEGNLVSGRLERDEL